jgi:hypothetical protein
MLGVHLTSCLDRRRGGWLLPVQPRHRVLRAVIVAALATVCLLSLATPRALAPAHTALGSSTTRGRSGAARGAISATSPGITRWQSSAGTESERRRCTSTRTRLPHRERSPHSKPSDCSPAECGSDASVDKNRRIPRLLNSDRKPTLSATVGGEL